MYYLYVIMYLNVYIYVYEGICMSQRTHLHFAPISFILFIIIFLITRRSSTTSTLTWSIRKEASKRKDSVGVMVLGLSISSTVDFEQLKTSFSNFPIFCLDNQSVKNMLMHTSIEVYVHSLCMYIIHTYKNLYQCVYQCVYYCIQLVYYQKINIVVS